MLDRLGPFLGTLYKPIDRVLMAVADAKAREIEADADVKVSEIRLRAANRLLEQTIREQEHLEKTVKQALPTLKEDAKPEEISDCVAKKI